MKSEVILASTSTFRAELMRSAGIAFRAIGSGFDESCISAATPREDAVQRARGKALEVSHRFPDAFVIGADQVLDFEGASLGKVDRSEEAAARLKMMSNKTHYLISAYCVTKAGDVLLERDVVIAMSMKDLSDAEVNDYIATEEWKGVAGCYQYENKGGALFNATDGETSAIIGLPMTPLLEDLKSLGICVRNTTQYMK